MLVLLLSSESGASGEHHKANQSILPVDGRLPAQLVFLLFLCNVLNVFISKLTQVNPFTGRITFHAVMGN